jgi:DnaK suppressor protein
MPKAKTKKKTTKTKSRAKKSPARKLTAVKKKAVARKTVVKKKKAAKALKKKAPEKSAGPKKRKVSFKREITKRLMADKQRVLAEVYHKVRSESDTSKFETGDIYDRASSERERELSLILGDREREKLAEIEDALERVKNKSYDICGECGEPIGEHRLRALPFTRVCVDCKSRSEREELVRGRAPEEAGLGIVERSEIEEEEF